MENSKYLRQRILKRWGRKLWFEIPTWARWWIFNFTARAVKGMHWIIDRFVWNVQPSVSNLDLFQCHNERPVISPAELNFLLYTAVQICRHFVHSDWRLKWFLFWRWTWIGNLCWCGPRKTNPLGDKNLKAGGRPNLKVHTVPILWKKRLFDYATLGHYGTSNHC